MCDEKEIQTGKKLMIIDTDAGIDDALALLLALSYRNEWQVSAITCCYGNTTVDNVCQNVMRILWASGAKEIPVYRGCQRPLLRTCTVGTFHGGDGLGNIAHEFSTGNLNVEEGHAVNALIKMARDHPRQITLVALSPLTNLAMAHRLDPEFTTFLKSLVVMGGSINGVGNATTCAEFNFHCDPDSAHIILTEACCPVHIVPWETAINHGMEWGLYRKWAQEETEKESLVQRITAYITTSDHEKTDKRFVDCDFLAVVAATCPQAITHSIKSQVSVDTTDTFAKGQMVLKNKSNLGGTNDEKMNTEIITKFNDDLLNQHRRRIWKIYQEESKQI